MMNLSTKSLVLTLICFTSAPTWAFWSMSAKSNCVAAFAKSQEEGEIAGQLTALAFGTEIYLKQEGGLPDLKSLAAQLETSQKVVKETIKNAFPGLGYKQSLVTLLLEDEKRHKKVVTAVYKQMKNFLTSHYRFPSWSELQETAEYPGEFLDAIWGDQQNLANSFLESEPSLLPRLRKKMTDTYASETKRRSRPTPYSTWLAILGLATDLEENTLFATDLGLFENYLELRNVAEKLKPRHFIDVINDDEFNDERLARFVSQIRKSKRLVITTAIAGADVDQNFLDSLETYCKANNAILVIIPADRRTFRLDEALMTSEWIHPTINEIELSKYLRLANARVMAKNFDPLTSLDRVGPRGQSVLVGSPKMFARVVPTVRNAEHPHLLLSTGAITRSDSYNSEIYRSQRGDYIAENDHVMGALVLELETSSALAENADINPYHMRHIEYKEARQGFVDLGSLYQAKGKISEERPLALVLGDLHLGDLDEAAKKKAFELIAKVRPRTLVLHDSFNGHSVSHYTEQDFIEKIKQIDSGRSDLVTELGMHVEFLNELLALDPDLKIIDNVSNHNLWLSRWIRSRSFATDSRNAKMGLILATAMTVEKVENPIEFAATVLGTREQNKELFKHVISDPERVIFMRIGENTRDSERLSALLESESDLGLELGIHGHVGANGARGSIRSLQKAEDVLVFGHTHTYNRRNRTINIGTMTKLNLGYNREGVSGWVQQLALVGNHHEVQVLNFQNGEWLASDGNRVSRKAFTSTYPRVKPLPTPSEAEQMDQYTRN